MGPELRIVGDDCRNRRFHHLVDILFLKRLGKPLLGLRAAHENKARRAGVHAGRASDGDIVYLAQQGIWHWSIGPSIVRPGVA